MLEDITTALRPSNEVKVVPTAHFNAGNYIPIDSKVSFRPFVEYLKEQVSKAADIRTDIYRFLIKKLEAEPALLRPIDNIRVLNDHTDLLELLTNSLFPLVSDKQRIFTLAAPYRFLFFNYSDAFGQLFIDPVTGEFLQVDDELTNSMKNMQCTLMYEHVLETFYGIKLNENTQLQVHINDPVSGMKRYYNLSYDRRFVKLRLNGELPDIYDCGVCMNTFRILDLERQMEKMPLSKFTAEGFALWIAEDVTAQEALESIKKILLRHENCDTGIVNEVKKNIHALVGYSEVEVGFTPFMKLNNRFVLDETCTKHSILGKNWAQNDEENIREYHQVIHLLQERPEPAAFTIFDESILQVAPMFSRLIRSGVKSYIIYPLQDEDGLLGLLELTSTISNRLDLDVMNRIEPAIPLLTLALLKTRNNFNQKVEKLIKENFTALQPSVEWKFAEVSWESLQGNNQNGSHKTIPGNVVFDGVFPIYGAIDIRNSSVERSLAMQKDLHEQLNRMDETLDRLLTEIQLPLLDRLKFKVHNFRSTIKSGMAAEDEIKFKEFADNELMTVFTHLQNSNKSVAPVIQQYLSDVDHESSFLYRNRNEYEESMSILINAVFYKLMEDEESIRQSYPHYFEKYKTDGVEYTIYIGQSIAPDIKFDLMYLQNLRLWQLKSMAEIAKITRDILPQLKVPLQTTQLILVHSMPISIGFRKDERRFDVEGAYNIRYEIMKKRLDKVHIDGTTERLTQPGKIAIVYSNPKESQEYAEYISYLQSKNLLKPGIENLELEELQGVRGLKALRVEVKS